MKIIITTDLFEAIIKDICESVVEYTNYCEYESSDHTYATEFKLSDGTKFTYDVALSSVDGNSILNGFKIDSFIVMESIKSEIGFAISDFVGVEVSIDGVQKDAPCHWCYDSYHIK